MSFDWDAAWGDDRSTSGFPDDLMQGERFAAPERDGVWNANNCPRCQFALIDGQCWRCDHGCPACGYRLDRDCFCAVCGVQSFKCPGESCVVCHGETLARRQIPAAPQPVDEFAAANVEDAA